MVGKLNTGYYMYSAPEMRFFSPESKLVHIDTDAGHVGSTHPTDVGIIADPKVALGKLAEALETGMSGEAKEAAKGRRLELAAEKAAMKASWKRRVKERWDRKPMSPERMMAEIAAALPPEVIIADDAVTSRDALYGALDFDEPGKVFGGRGGALGWGMGGAMGLKLARPERPIVGILGDGSAMMTVQGLWTAAVENIPVVYVICNNRAYRVLKLNMNAYKAGVLNEEKIHSRYLGMDFPRPLDMAGMAEAMGVYGRKIEDPEELRPAIGQALGLGRPAVLDVVIDGSV